MVSDITTLLLNRGFKLAKSNIPNVSLFFLSPELSVLDFCIVINNTESNPLATDFISGLCNAIERNYLLQGMRKVNFFCIVLSDYIERDKGFLTLNHPFWLVDTLEHRVLVYDNQPSDYYQTKDALEQILVKKSRPFSSPDIRNLPIVTIALVIINILLYAITSYLSEGNITYYLFKYGGSYWRFIYEEHEYYRLFTCMFLHFTLDHLANNMITLAIMGKETEVMLGRLRFLCIYLLSGLGASLMSSLYYMHNSTDEIIVSAGASGAIFGVLGALIIMTLLYPKYRRQVHPFNIILVAILSLSNGLTSTSIDNIGHIGGLLFGIIITFISCLCRKNIIK